MDSQIFQQIKDVLDKNNTIGIAVGKNPTIDEMGAALSFYLALKHLNKNAGIACPTEPIVEISSLVGIDKVKKALDGAEGSDLVVSFPYKEGEIEKVSYTLEEGFLNIVVKPGEAGISFSKSDVLFKRGGGSPTVLFIIGTPNLSNLGDLFDPEALKNTIIINIDNKRENQGFGEIVFVSQKYSSVSEQIASLLSFLNLEMDIDISQNLMSGISFATNNFSDPKTSLYAFETAAMLMKNGAKREISALKPKTQFFGQEDDFEDDFGRSKDFGKPQTRPKSFDDLESFRPEEPKFYGQGVKQPSFNQAHSQKRSFQKGVSQFGQQNPQMKQKQNQQNAFPKQSQNTGQNAADDEETPSDWLTPKIYKGSGSIE